MAKGERFKWLKGLTLALQILFWSIAALEGAALGLWICSAVFQPPSSETFYSLGGVPFLLGLAPYAITIPVLPAWTAAAAAARPTRPHDGTRLWAWLGYLIPVISYVAPVLVLRTLAQEIAHSDHGLRVLALVFWLVRLITSVAGVFIMLVVASVALHSPGPDDGAVAFFAVVAASLCAGSLLGARLVGRLSRAVIAHATGVEQAAMF